MTEQQVALGEGRVDITALLESGLASEREYARKLLELDKATRENMSPPGAFRIPPLLERRRLQYGITDHYFQEQAVFDRITIFQLSQFKGETFGDTRIIMPEVTQKKEMESAPRGIIVSAGLKALDNLRSNGIDVGHIVSFVRQAPFRKRAGLIGGKSVWLLILRDGDVLGSEDLWDAQQRGECEVRVIRDADGCATHVLADNVTGKTWTPKLPWADESY
jgi:hypothetical protein